MAEKKDHGAELRQEYERWDQLFYHGGQDPFWTDGDNLELVRNHIIASRSALGQEGGDMPEEYGWPLPPEVPRDYMARVKEIWYRALESYKRYTEDENYQHLKKVSGTLPDEWKKACCLKNVLGYVSSVRKALEQRDYVTLRRHEHPERYLESFAECRKRIEKMERQERENMGKPEKPEAEKKKETGQLNLFQMGLGISR